MNVGKEGPYFIIHSNKNEIFILDITEEQDSIPYPQPTPDRCECGVKYQMTFSNSLHYCFESETNFREWKDGIKNIQYQNIGVRMCMHCAIIGRLELANLDVPIFYYDRPNLRSP